MHVLIVDDSPSVAEALRWALNAEGHEVTVVDKGMRGLLDHTHPAWTAVQVLICDLMMPDVKGADIMRVCQLAYPDVKRICLTGSDDLGGLIAEAAKYAHLILQKPSEFELILSAVADA